VSKDKKKKKKDKAGKSGSFKKTVHSLSQNPMVADVVAAALVATASALKDSNKARRLAEYAGDELEALSKKSAQRGNAMWKLALDVGRHALETFASEAPEAAKRSPANRSSSKRTKAKKSAGSARKAK
jgi:hypothetical protein